MKLSSYLSQNEKKWNEEEHLNAQKLIEYLEPSVKENLFEIADSKDELTVFKKLSGWLFQFYHAEFLEGLVHIGYDYQKYKKELIYSFILSVTRNRSNVRVLYDMLVSKGIIVDMISFDDSTYEIVTVDFGTIKFEKAAGRNDKETEQYLESLGNRVVDGCHEMSFFMLKKDATLRAVTSICTKGLNCRYYHSFLLDSKDNVIDLTANLVMPKEQYYLLQGVEELNVVDYEEYLLEEQESIEHDESGTLFDLLRNALYKEILRKDK